MTHSDYVTLEYEKIIPDRPVYSLNEQIRDEVQDMFREFSSGEVWGLPAAANITVSHRKRYSEGIGDHKNENGRFIRKNSTYRIEEKKAIVTSVRDHSFYGKNGNTICAIEMMKHGYSANQTAKVLNMSKNTTRKLLRELGDIKCGCGKPSGHKGWCKFRYEKSEARQAFMKRWGIKTA